MPLFNSIEWLALQRIFFKKPKLGLEKIREGFVSPSNTLKEAENDLEYIKKFGFKLIPWDSDNYPPMLKLIYDAPLVLLAKGNWPRWEEKVWVAIVGARKATPFGRAKTKEIVKELAAAGIGIVSGLAYGIDSEAHRACLEVGGTTWGVLGSGIDSIYPPTNFELSEKMAVNGGVLSEFPLGTKPYPAYFPQRNRVISGLSYAVIVIEAGIKSGSLITANFALEQGREVFVIPPPKKHVAYEGTAKLLDEGAHPYESVDQLLELIQPLREVGPVPKERGKKQEAEKQRDKKSENPLLAHMKQPRSLDYLLQITQKPAAVLLSELSQLEAEGFVKKIPGALWQSR